MIYVAVFWAHTYSVHSLWCLDWLPVSASTIATSVHHKRRKAARSLRCAKCRARHSRSNAEPERPQGSTKYTKCSEGLLSTHVPVSARTMRTATILGFNFKIWLKIKKINQAQSLFLCHTVRVQTTFEPCQVFFDPKPRVWNHRTGNVSVTNKLYSVWWGIHFRVIY